MNGRQASHPAKHFTDERVHAAQIWFPLYRSETKSYQETKQERAEREAAKQKRQTPSPRFLAPKQEKARREHEELERETNEFQLAQMERFKRLAGGPDSFLLDQTIELIEKEYCTSDYETMDELIRSKGFEKHSEHASRMRSALVTCINLVKP